MAELGTLGVIITLILGTLIFIAINTIFEIWYFNRAALFGEWFGCCVVAYIIVGFLGGIIGGVFSVIWFLIRLALMIGVIGYIGYYLYNKFNKSKE